MSLAGRVTHVGICVANLDEGTRFWTALGFTRASGRPEGRYEGSHVDALLRLRDVVLDNVFLERDGLCIELLHYVSPPCVSGARPMNHTGFTHLSIRVPDLERAIAAVVEAGGRLLPETLLEIGGQKVAAFLVGPGDVAIELTQGA